MEHGSFWRRLKGDLLTGHYRQMEVPRYSEARVPDGLWNSSDGPRYSDTLHCRWLEANYTSAGVGGNYQRRLVGGWQESMDRCLSHQAWVALRRPREFCISEHRSQRQGDSDARKGECILLLGHIVLGWASFSACRSDGQCQRIAAAEFLIPCKRGDTTLSPLQPPRLNPALAHTADNSFDFGLPPTSRSISDV